MAMAIYQVTRLVMYCDKCRSMLAILEGPESHLQAMQRTTVTCRNCITAPLAEEE